MFLLIFCYLEVAVFVSSSFSFPYAVIMWRTLEKDYIGLFQMCDSCVDHIVRTIESIISHHESTTSSKLAAKCDEMIIMRFGITQVAHMPTFTKHCAISYNTCNAQNLCYANAQNTIPMQQWSLPHFSHELLSKPPGYFSLFFSASCLWLDRSPCLPHLLHSALWFFLLH